MDFEKSVGGEERNGISRLSNSKHGPESHSKIPKPLDISKSQVKYKWQEYSSSSGGSRKSGHANTSGGQSEATTAGAPAASVEPANKQQKEHKKAETAAKESQRNFEGRRNPAEEQGQGQEVLASSSAAHSSNEAAQPQKLSMSEATAAQTPAASPCMSFQQHHPASPAKRAAADEECTAEKRSRARGPSKEEDQSGSPNEDACLQNMKPTTQAKPSQGDRNVLDAAADRGTHAQAVSAPDACPPGNPTARTAEQEANINLENRRVPPLQLDQLPAWATHQTSPQPPGVRPYPQVRQSPSPVNLVLDSKEEESEDDELESWMHEPRWLPDSDGKGHVYKPVSRKELRQYESLITELQPHQAQQVSQLWDSLHQARQSCEHMTNRGVRAAKNVMEAYTRHVSDLVEQSGCYEKQVKELMLLTQHQTCAIEALQLKLTAARQIGAAPYSASKRMPTPASSLFSQPTDKAHFGHSRWGHSSHRQQLCAMEASAVLAGATPPASTAKSAQEGCAVHKEERAEDGHGVQKEARAEGSEESRMIWQELEGARLENAKLSSVNRELVKNLDSITLLFAGAQAKIDKLSSQLECCSEQNLLLEKQLWNEQQQQRPNKVCHRYDGAVPAHDPPSKHAPRPFLSHLKYRAPSSTAMEFAGMHAGPGMHANPGTHSAALGNEYRRAAFRALLSRGGVL